MSQAPACCRRQHDYLLFLLPARSPAPTPRIPKVAGAGEKTAEFIKNDAPFLIPVIRKGLDYVVEKYKE
jgi:hypothetical protein